MLEDFKMEISQKCPNCGGVKFIFDDKNPNTKYTCNNCKRVFTKKQLFEVNKQNALDAVKGKVLKDIKKSFKLK